MPKLPAMRRAAFALGMLFAPLLAGILYRKRAWKKQAGKGHGIGGGGTPIFDELHKEREVSTPRMGGILVWAGTLATALAFFVSPWWLLLPAFAGLNLIQSVFTGFCPPTLILRKLGWLDDAGTIHWGGR